MSKRTLGLTAALLLCAGAMTALPVAPAQAADTANVKCHLKFSLSGWSILYKHAEGQGVVTCDNGQSAPVKISVVGGGLTALEAASEIAEAHPRLAVTLVASTLAPSLSPRAVGYVREALAALGVSVHEGVAVRAISDGAVTLDTGESLPAAFAVWAGGFVPAGPTVESDLARWLPWRNSRYGLRAQLRVNNVMRDAFPPYASGPASTGVQAYGDWRGRVASLSLTAKF